MIKDECRLTFTTLLWFSMPANNNLIQLESSPTQFANVSIFSNIWLGVKAMIDSLIKSTVFPSPRSPRRPGCQWETWAAWAPRPRWWRRWTGPAWCCPAAWAAPCSSWTGPISWSPPASGGTPSRRRTWWWWWCVLTRMFSDLASLLGFQYSVGCTGGLTVKTSFRWRRILHAKYF